MLKDYIVLVKKIALYAAAMCIISFIMILILGVLFGYENGIFYGVWIVSSIFWMVSPIFSFAGVYGIYAQEADSYFVVSLISLIITFSLFLLSENRWEASYQKRLLVPVGVAFFIMFVFSGVVYSFTNLEIFGSAGVLEVVAILLSTRLIFMVSEIIKRKIFHSATKEVKECIQKLDAYIDQANIFSSIELKRKVKELLKDEGKTLISLRDDNLSVEQLVWLLISNVVSEMLISGKFHTYRGVLNVEGDNLRSLWRKSVNELHSSGYYSDDEYQKDMDWMREELVKVG